VLQISLILFMKIKMLTYYYMRKSKEIEFYYWYLRGGCFMSQKCTHSPDRSDRMNLNFIVLVYSCLNSGLGVFQFQVVCCVPLFTKKRLNVR